MNNYYKLENKIKYICDKEYKFFFNKANVVGVGLGYKIKNGILTSQKTITILVKKKYPCNYLNFKDIIPKQYKDILTDVIESGTINSASLKDRIRPVLGGYSIGASTGSGNGSMGCLVKCNNIKFLLCNNHVIAGENKEPIGSDIVQPSVADGGKKPIDTIANLSRYIPIHFIKGKKEPHNFVDCALGNLVNDSIASSSMAYIGKIRGIKPLSISDEVLKIGSATGRTYGNIILLDATLTVGFLSGLDAIFKKQVITTKMTDKGDSGAILLNKQNYALGLFFAESNSYSFFNRIDIALNALNVEIITN